MIIAVKGNVKLEQVSHNEYRVSMAGREDCWASPTLDHAEYIYEQLVNGADW